MPPLFITRSSGLEDLNVYRKMNRSRCSRAVRPLITSEQMKGRTIKDLKDLRAFCVSACYRHLGPKGPKSVGCDRLIATGQDLAILHYRFAVRLRCAAPVHSPALQVWKT